LAQKFKKIGLNFKEIKYINLPINVFIYINQLDALNFTISLFQAPRCFEHMSSKHVEA